MATGTSGVAELEKTLLSGRNSDGGWGYYRGKASRLEPTCWGLLALHAARAVGGEAAVLRNWPTADNILLERAGGQTNFGFHGVALLSLRALRIDHVTGTPNLVAALQRVKGMALKPSTINRQDNTLQAWSWVPETFSWVEPTACCLLALKKWRDQPGVAIDNERIAIAERLLIDRACNDGGWNYGNSNMLGQLLTPYVPTTALALMSLRDRRTDPVVRRGHEYLLAHATTEPSGLSLALALLALMSYGSVVEPVRAVLAEQIPTTLALGNQLAIALSLLALRLEPHDAAAIL